MMWLDYLLLPRSTIELAHLNRIWEAYNEQKLSPQQVRTKLLQRKWKHHIEKADLLLQFTTKRI